MSRSADYRNYVNRLYSKRVALTPFVLEVKKKRVQTRIALVNLFEVLMTCRMYICVWYSLNWLTRVTKNVEIDIDSGGFNEIFDIIYAEIQNET